MNRFCSVLASITIVIGLGVADARAQVFAVESPSYVRQMVTAAHQIVQQHPQLTFVVRTTEQVLSEDEAALRAVVAASRVIVLGRVYGDVAEKLRGALAAIDLTGKTIFAVYSEPDVMRLTRLNGRFVFEGVPESTIRAIADSLGGDDVATVLAEWERKDPRLQPWAGGVAYVVAKGPVNFQNLFSYLMALSARPLEREPAAVDPVPAYFAYANGRIYREFDSFAAALDTDRPVVAIIDHDGYFHSGDLKLLDSLAGELAAVGFRPLPIVAAWGEPTYRALKEFLVDQRDRIHLTAIVSLQSFVLGGDQARDKVSALVSQLGVPVFRAIRLPKRAPDAWKTSEDGLPWSSVYYQVAMPELQGMIEPILVGAEKEEVIDAATGARISVFEPISERIRKLARRVRRWHALQTLPNTEKRIAIVYYNHPPGKQNIGADYLNVPATILQLLALLESTGYETGEYPQDEEFLLDVLLTRPGAR